MAEDRFLTPDEIAEILKVKTVIVRSWLNNEEHPLKGAKMGKLWRIEKEDLERYIENQKEGK